MSPKIRLGRLVLVGVLLTMDLADAQQLTKRFRIGYLSVLSPSSDTAPRTASGKVCGSLVTPMVRTLSSNHDTQKAM